jgi:hypothetical protein
MGGGLIQLVAYGVQDIYLTDDPQITFFKVVYKRYTNFSMEPIKQFFNTDIDFGKRVVCNVGRQADLISNTYLYIQLPFIKSFKLQNLQSLDNLKKFAWIKKIGYGIIKEIAIEIAGQLIDTHYGDWLNIWSELTNHHEGLDDMIGNIKELTSFTNGKQSYGLYIPLEFWFCKNSGLALPLVALQYCDIKIHVELNNAIDTYILGPTHSIKIINNFVGFKQFEYIEQILGNNKIGALYMDYDELTNTLYYLKINNIPDNSFSIEPIVLDNITGDLISTPIIGQTSGYSVHPATIGDNTGEMVYTIKLEEELTISNSYLLINYIYLDTEERKRFATSNHEFIIEQLQYNGSKTISSNNITVNLTLNHPVKEIIWVGNLNNLLNGYINDKFNYTNDYILDDKNNRGTNMIKSTTLLLNSNNRFQPRNGNYFNWVVPYEKHKKTPSTGIYVYSFSIYPEQIQPSGSCNMSKIDNIRMAIEFDGTISSNNTVDLRIYATNYNIFRIIHGIGGLVFSN